MTDFTARFSTRNPMGPRLRFAAVTSAIGLALLLTGCSGSATPDPSTEPTAPTEQAELGKLDAATVEETARTFAAGHAGSTVLDGAQIRAQIPATEKWLKTVVIDPERCGMYGGQTLSEQLEAAELAVVSIPGTDGHQPTQITVSSYRESETLVADISTQQYLDKDCGSFTVTSGKTTVKNTIETIDVESDVPYASGILSTATNNKKTTKSLTIRAVDGHIMVTSTRDAGSDATAAAQAAQADVEQMLTLLHTRSQ